MLTLLPIIAALKRFGGLLMRLNPWQLALIALGLFALVQHFELAHVRKNAAAYLKQRDDYKHQLTAISTKRNEQQIVTRDRIVTVLQKQRTADDKARVIEQASLPGQCKSPKEVLDADL